MAKIVQFDDSGQQIKFYIEPEAIPFISYTDFVKHFAISEKEVASLKNNGFIGNDKIVSLRNLIDICNFFAFTNNFDKAFHIHSVSKYPLEEMSDNLQRKFKLLLKFCNSSMKYYFRFFKIQQELIIIVKKKIDMLVLGSKIVDHEIIDDSAPDLFLQVGNKLAIVKIKKNIIERENIVQLDKLIKLYNAAKGYLFAPKIDEKIKLPQNMEYIKIDFDKKF